MEQLHPHWTNNRPTVQEKEVPSTSGIFHRVLDEFDDRLRFEFGATAKTEIALEMFDSHVTHAVV